MNERDIIDKDNGSVIAFTQAIDSILDSMESAFSNYKPFLDGVRFLTDEEVSKLLHISRRTLQDYRTQGKSLIISLVARCCIRNRNWRIYCKRGIRKRLIYRIVSKRQGNTSFASLKQILKLWTYESSTIILDLFPVGSVVLFAMTFILDLRSRNRQVFFDRILPARW